MWFNDALNLFLVSVFTWEVIQQCHHGISQQYFEKYIDPTLRREREIRQRITRTRTNLRRNDTTILSLCLRHSNVFSTVSRWEIFDDNERDTVDSCSYVENLDYRLVDELDRRKSRRRRKENFISVLIHIHIQADIDRSRASDRIYDL